MASRTGSAVQLIRFMIIHPQKERVRHAFRITGSRQAQAVHPEAGARRLKPARESCRKLRRWRLWPQSCGCERIGDQTAELSSLRRPFSDQGRITPWNEGRDAAECHETIQPKVLARHAVMIVHGSCSRHHLHLGAGRFACIERLRQGRRMRCRLNEQPASDQ